MASNATSQPPTAIGGDEKAAAKTNPPAAALVLGTDIFGIELVNCQLTADRYARDLGIPVYVPDVFDGQALPVWVMDVFLTLTGVLNQNTAATHAAAGGDNTKPPARTWPQLFGRIWQIVTCLVTLLPAVLPFFARHIVPHSKRTCKTVRYEKVITHLRSELGVQRVGYAGYCYGVLYGLLFGTKTKGEVCHVDANILLHGEVSYAQCVPLQAPTLFICADKDHAFPDAVRAKAQATLTARNEAANAGADGKTPKFVFRHYPGTYHGFTMRGNDDLPVVYRARQDAYAECVTFLSAHLHLKP